MALFIAISNCLWFSDSEAVKATSLHQVANMDEFVSTQVHLYMHHMVAVVSECRELLICNLLLAGALPPTGGDIRVLGHSLLAPGGLEVAQAVMGVCPQFDVLWDELSGSEHMYIYGCIKGLQSTEVSPDDTAGLHKVFTQCNFVVSVVMLSSQHGSTILLQTLQCMNTCLHCL